jgi:hypothetical protein
MIGGTGVMKQEQETVDVMRKPLNMRKGGAGTGTVEIEQEQGKEEELNKKGNRRSGEVLLGL